MNKSGYGGVLEASTKENCSKCQLNDVCHDPRKKSNFCCTYFQGDVGKRGEDPAAYDFLQYMRTLAKSESVIFDPYGIDDRDAPLAPNFFRWCTSSKFLNAQPTPYPWQLENGIRLFGDGCPWCSEKSWYNSIPFDCDPLEIPDHIRLRKNGVCPECNRSIVDGINAGVENDKSVFIGVVGQRAGKCLVGSTIVNTDKGIIKIKDILVGDKISVIGRYYSVTKKFKTKSKKIGIITTKSGYSVEGTPDHHVMTPNGWQPINLAKIVRIRAEPAIWGSNIAFLKKWRGKIPNKDELLQYLFDTPKEKIAEKIKDFLFSEALSQNTLLLKFGESSPVIQQVLLKFGIFSKIIGNVLAIQQPWAKRYLEFIGIQDCNIYAQIWHSRKIFNNTVGKEVSHTYIPLMSALGESINKSDLLHPRDKVSAQILQSTILDGSLNNIEAAKGARLLRRLPLPNAQIKYMLISFLEDLSSYNCIWDEVASFKRTGRADVYDIEVENAHRFIANGIEVHNSTGVGFVASYQQHRLLKLKNPSKFYGIKNNTILHSNFVGISFTRVKMTVWDPIMALIQDSPWYKTYHEILDDAGSNRTDNELYKVTDTFTMYRNAALRSSPSSPSSRSLRGPTRILFVIDELGHFSEDKTKINISGQETWNVLLNSLQTVRPEVYRLRKEGVIAIPPALAMGISSPRDVADPIMTLRKSEMNKKHSFVVMRPTWEANPKLTFEMLEEEINDKVSLWRDFGCKPPFSESPFVASYESMFDIVDESRRSLFTQQTVPVVSKGGDKRSVSIRLKYKWLDHSVPKILAIDAGRVLNAFSGAIAHINTDGIFIYDAFFEVRPRTNMHVAYTSVYENVISRLIEKYNIVAMVSDRWQNYKFLDDAKEDHNLLSASLQLQYGDFIEWRDALNGRMMSMPQPEIPLTDIIDINHTEEEYFDDRPVAQFIRQAIRVIDNPGKGVDKPASGNDDVFRSAVVAFAAAKIPEVARVLRKGNANKGSVGAIATYGSFDTYPKEIMHIGISSNMNTSMLKVENAPATTNPKILKDVKSIGGRAYIRKAPPSRKK